MFLFRFCCFVLCCFFFAGDGVRRHLLHHTCGQSACSCRSLLLLCIPPSPVPPSPPPPPRVKPLLDKVGDARRSRPCPSTGSKVRRYRWRRRGIAFRTTPRYVRSSSSDIPTQLGFSRPPSVAQHAYEVYTSYCIRGETHEGGRTSLDVSCGRAEQRGCYAPQRARCFAEELITGLLLGGSVFALGVIGFSRLKVVCCSVCPRNEERERGGRGETERQANRQRDNERETKRRTTTAGRVLLKPTLSSPCSASSSCSSYRALYVVGAFASAPRLQLLLLLLLLGPGQRHRQGQQQRKRDCEGRNDAPLA